MPKKKEETMVHSGVKSSATHGSWVWIESVNACINMDAVRVLDLKASKIDGIVILPDEMKALADWWMA